MTGKAWIGLCVSMICLVLLGLTPTQRKRAPILGTPYKLVFHSIEGLKLGDPVMVGGVEAGRVANIDFAPRDDWKHLNQDGSEQPVVLVTVSLENNRTIPTNAGYKVVSTLKGTHFLNIVPGPGGTPLGADQILNGELQADNQDTLSITLKNFKTLSRSTDFFRTQFGDQNFRRDIKDLASNMRFYSREFKTQSTSANAQLDKMKGMLDRQEAALLARAEALDAQAERAHNYLNRLIPVARQQMGTYRQQMVDAQKQLDLLYTRADQYNKLLAVYVKSAEKRMAGIDQQKLASQAHKLATKLEDYSALAGDLHAISSDPGVRADLKKMATKYKDQARQLNETVKHYDHLLDNYKWLKADSPEH